VCKRECHSFRAKQYLVCKIKPIYKKISLSPFLFNLNDNWTLLYLKHVILYIPIHRIFMKNHVSFSWVLFFFFSSYLPLPKYFLQTSIFIAKIETKLEWHQAIVREVMNHVTIMVVVWGVCCGLSESHQPHTALGNLGNSVGPFQATTCVGRRKTSGLWHQSEGSWKINLTFTIFPPWKSGKHFLDDFLENLSEDWPMVYRKTIVLAFFLP